MLFNAGDMGGTSKKQEEGQKIPAQEISTSNSPVCSQVFIIYQLFQSL